MSRHNFKFSIYALAALVAMPMLGTACSRPKAAQGAPEGDLHANGGGLSGWLPSIESEPAPSLPNGAVGDINSEVANAQNAAQELAAAIAQIAAIVKQNNSCAVENNCRVLEPNELAEVERGDYGCLINNCDLDLHIRACNAFYENPDYFPLNERIWGRDWRSRLGRWSYGDLDYIYDGDEIVDGDPEFGFEWFCHDGRDEWRHPRDIWSDWDGGRRRFRDGFDGWRGGRCGGFDGLDGFDDFDDGLGLAGQEWFCHDGVEERRHPRDIWSDWDGGRSRFRDGFEGWRLGRCDIDLLERSHRICFAESNSDVIRNLRVSRRELDLLFDDGRNLKEREFDDAYRDRHLVGRDRDRDRRDDRRGRDDRRDRDRDDFDDDEFFDFDDNEFFCGRLFGGDDLLLLGEFKEGRCRDRDDDRDDDDGDYDRDDDHGDKDYGDKYPKHHHDDDDYNVPCPVTCTCDEACDDDDEYTRDSCDSDSHRCVHDRDDDDHHHDGDHRRDDDDDDDDDDVDPDDIVGCINNSNCNDNNVCTTDTCDRSTHQCVFTAMQACCTTASQCNDNNVCTTDTCNPTTNKCSNVAMQGCCTTNAQCAGNVGGNTLCNTTSNTCVACLTNTDCPAPTGINAPCNTVVCNGTGVCSTTKLTKPADDGNLCNSHDQCNNGVLVLGEETNVCDDGDPCTQDPCDITGTTLATACALHPPVVCDQLEGVTTGPTACAVSACVISDGGCTILEASCDGTTGPCEQACLPSVPVDGEPDFDDLICVDVSSATANCGGCAVNPDGSVGVGVACTGVTPVCSEGGCVASAACTGTSPDQCGDGCVNLSNDPLNCGACKVACLNVVPNGAGHTCIDGVCSDICLDFFGNCDNNVNNGCETDLLTDDNNCGACGFDCGETESCMNGVCVAI